MKIPATHQSVQQPRGNPFGPIAVLGLILVGVFVIVVVVKLVQPAEIIPWRTDFAAATDESHRSGKPVLVYLTASWCGPCQSLKSTTWASQDVENAMRQFVPVKVDIDEHPEIARRFNPDGVPFFAVLDQRGEPARSTVGALPPEEFIGWLKG